MPSFQSKALLWQDRSQAWHNRLVLAVGGGAVSTYIYIYTYTRIHIRTHARVYVCIYVCVYLCMYACMHACTYIHIYIDIHGLKPWCARSGNLGEPGPERETTAAQALDTEKDSLSEFYVGSFPSASLHAPMCRCSK